MVAALSRFFLGTFNLFTVYSKIVIDAIWSNIITKYVNMMMKIVYT